jgi:hypothetical protein
MEQGMGWNVVAQLLSMSWREDVSPAGFWWGPLALLPDRVGASLGLATTLNVYNSAENTIIRTLGEMRDILLCFFVVLTLAVTINH